MYAKLADNTIVENILNGSTAHSIIAVRSTYGEAGAIRDLFTEENAVAIRIFDDEDKEIDSAGDLVLLTDVALRKSGDGILVEVKMRDKTEMEKLHEQVAELQDVIIEG